MSSHGVGRREDITVEGLRETFSRWRIVHADGAWWAVRGGTVTWDGPDSLLLRVITASDLPGLAERLCVQEWIDGLDEAALAAVYQHRSMPGLLR
jgi:hypothetical protein